MIYFRAILGKMAIFDNSHQRVIKKHTMSVSKIAFVLLAFLFFVSCESEPQQQTVTEPETPIQQEEETETPNEEEQPTATYETEITSKLRAYYDDLEQEQMDESKYFAPVVEAFYSQKNQDREKIGTIIRSGFEGIVERKIVLDDRSYNFSQEGETYIVEFEGFAEVRRKGENESKTESFQNRFVFNKEYQIIEYGPALQAKTLTEIASPSQEAAQSAAGLLRALSDGDFEAADAFIHPEIKLKYLTRPGAYDVIYTISSLKEVLEYNPWMEDVFQFIDCELKQESLPGYDCDDFDKQGCFIADVEGYDRLVDNMQALTEAEIATFTQSQMNDATEVQRLVQAQLTNTDQTIAMLFGNIDGKWYLLVLDKAIYDCSA